MMPLLTSLPFFHSDLQNPSFYVCPTEDTVPQEDGKGCNVTHRREHKEQRREVNSERRVMDSAESSTVMCSSAHLFLPAMGVTVYKSEINPHQATEPALGGGDPKATGRRKE